MKKFSFIILTLFCLTISFSGCKNTPSGLSAEVEPTIRVYNTSTKTTDEMPLERYVAGVVAGEVYNDWPEEALKTQCVLARTFALKYASDNPEVYKNKGISTNIADAQSYDESTINERVLKAVSDTRGQIITSNGKIINAYFPYIEHFAKEKNIFILI